MLSLCSRTVSNCLDSHATSRAFILLLGCLLGLTCAAIPTGAAAQDAPARIPAIGWTRGIGVPPKNPGHGKPEGYPMIDDGYDNGAPVGGFGAGTIGRGYDGAFSRYHLKIGAHKYVVVPSNQFALYAREKGGRAWARALWTGRPKKTLQAWKWNYPAGAGTYHALYPKSWFSYRSPRLPVEATVEQFSPILPHNYRATSYPVAVYNWTLRNPGAKPVTVGILFSWTNMIGWFRGWGHGFHQAQNMDNFNRVRRQPLPAGEMTGIILDRHRAGGVRQDWDGQFAIATLALPGVRVTTHATFAAQGSGAAIWKTFSRTGELDNFNSRRSSAGGPLAGALAITITLQPGQTRVIPMVLAWDLPLARFGQGQAWYRRYTRFFGRTGTHAWRIARRGLERDAAWSEAINRWQAPYIHDASAPAWYRGMLFNEMYDLADGGTFWEDGRMGGPARRPGQRDKFTWLECFDYPYYSTLDVRFYGSFPLLRWWPRLERTEMRDFAATVPQQLNEIRRIGWSHKLAKRKNSGALPHDLGEPTENPLLAANAYNWQDVNVWKDLNTKFVLQVWRDYYLNPRHGARDLAFLRQTWPAVRQSLAYLTRFETSGNGIPQNAGIPDQTYDVWPMRGDSAYCGSLWLASLKAAAKMAAVLNDSAAGQQYRVWYARAQPNFIQHLWNGHYFDYDTGSPYRHDVMADQLVGQWYADLTGLGRLVPRRDTDAALRTVFRLNIMGFDHGRMGAVNGMTPAGKVVSGNEQAGEVWTGVTLALASFYIAEHMPRRGFVAAHGIYHVVYHRGYWFRTPEAWDRSGDYRASMYMRPGAIWAMQYARRLISKH